MPEDRCNKCDRDKGYDSYKNIHNDSVDNHVEKKAQHEVIWVTGASSGIGLALCKLLSQKGHRVIASARNTHMLEQLAKTRSNIYPLTYDVTDTQSITDIQAKLSAINPFLDRVILNAGTCQYLDFPEPKWDYTRSIMDVNFHGAINCIQASLPLLKKSQHNGHIIGICSLVTQAPFAKAEAYGASKAALCYLLESLRIDLAPEKIDVTIVNPGFVDTPLTRKNNFPMPFILSAERAAYRIVRGAFNRPHEYSFPKRLKLLLQFSRLAPRLWLKLMSVSKKEYRNTETRISER